MSETYISSDLKGSLQPINGRGFYTFLFIYFIILLIPAYWLNVYESTDARYSEIAREMLRSGNFMEPYYNGIKHFHKPPFTYWITALGLQIFGINGLGARFFSAVFAVLTLIYTRKTAYVLTGDRDKADVSVLVLASSLLFIVVGRVVSTDIFLTFFSISALYYIFSQMYVSRSILNAVMAGLMIGLGFLTKGPIIFLFTLLPFITAKIFDKGHRKVFSFREILAGLLVFAVVALPWYLYVVSVNEGLLRYFLYDQTVERVADSSRFGRNKPFYFFPFVFLVTLFPFVHLFFKDMKKPSGLKPGWTMYLYVLMPFIVFELSASKLANYILPFYPAAAIIIASRMRRAPSATVVEYVFMIISFALIPTPFIVKFMRVDALPIALAATALFALTGYCVYKKVFIKRYLLAVTGYLLMLSLVINFALILSNDHFKGYENTVNDIKKFDPASEYPVVLFMMSAPSVSFYFDDVKPVMFGMKRETNFQTEAEISAYYRNTPEGVAEYLRSLDEYIIITSEKKMPLLKDYTKSICGIISHRAKDKVVLFCRNY